MSKRARGGESLTGGTGDVNPQFMQWAYGPTLAGTTESFALNLPVNRMQGKGTVIIEVLKVWFEVPTCPDLNPANPPSWGHINYRASLATRDYGANVATLEQPGIVAMTWKSFSVRSGSATATIPAGVQERINMIDLTDGAGHGVLVATDNMYLQLSGDAVWATYITCRVLYRMKSVGLTEYVGLVQSQQ